MSLALLNSFEVSYSISSAHRRVDLRSIPPELFSVAVLCVSNADLPASPVYNSIITIVIIIIRDAPIRQKSAPDNRPIAD